MLVEFRLRNYRSIRDEQVLSLMASNTAKELPANIFTAAVQGKPKLVHSAVIYGANAAGKSNLIRALHTMREIILYSAKESQRGESFPVERFLFEKQTIGKPSLFEITFLKAGIRYQYGFSVDETRVHEEWLYAYPSVKGQQWFSRVYDKKTKKYDWAFSKNFTGEKQLWIQATRENALFLSTAVQLNNRQLAPVFDWFQSDLMIFSAHAKISQRKSFEQLEGENGKAMLLPYMKIADPSVNDILFDSKPFSENDLPMYLPTEHRERLKKHLSGTKSVSLALSHPGNVALEMDEESQGTQKLFAYAGHWIDALQNGKVLIVDELDNSLHPLAARFLIQLLSHTEHNPKHAQLVFSTHDTSLLDNQLLRRDQIWFVEKDKHHATQLYPLTDFSPRKQEAIGKGYLQGRYGAIPFIGEWGF